MQQNICKSSCQNFQTAITSTSLINQSQKTTICYCFDHHLIVSIFFQENMPNFFWFQLQMRGFAAFLCSILGLEKRRHHLGFWKITKNSLPFVTLLEILHTKRFIEKIIGRFIAKKKPKSHFVVVFTNAHRTTYKYIIRGL